MQSAASHLLRESDRENFFLWCMGFNPMTKNQPGGPQYRKKFDPEKDLLEQIEEVTLHVRQRWAVTDHNSSTDTAYQKTVLQGTTANLVERTQDPDFSKGNKLPGDMAIMTFAAAAVGRLAAYGTVAQRQSTQETFDSSVLQAMQGGARMFEVSGPEFMDYGPAILPGGFDATNTSVLPTVPRHFRALNAPRILGNEQTLQIYHYISRTTDFGVLLDVDYYFPSLIGRRR